MSKIKDMLFLDPQDQEPGEPCPRCGGARYKPSLTCIRCERDGR